MDKESWHMFKKKTYIKVEFLKDKPVITANIHQDTEPEMVADFVNNLISRNYLEYLLKAIMESSKKNKAVFTGREICEDIVSYNNGIEIKPIVYGRNPIVKPSEVMKVYDEEN